MSLAVSWLGLHLVEARRHVPLVFRMAFGGLCPRAFQFRLRPARKGIPPSVTKPEYRSPSALTCSGSRKTASPSSSMNAVRKVLARQFLDIRYRSTLPRSFLAYLQRLERVVRARSARHTGGWCGLKNTSAFVIGFGLLIDVLRRQQQRAVAVVLEEPAVRLAVEVAVLS